jgi:hypothetical protein
MFVGSLKLSTVPYTAGPESRGHSWIAWLHLYISMLNCFPSFIVRWILNLIKTMKNWYPTNKSDFTGNLFKTVAQIEIHILLSA